MELNKTINFRIIEQDSLAISCYFYGFFKAPGLKNYPDLAWVNDDYNLIKSKNLSFQDCSRIANNLFLIGQNFNLFNKVDYFIMMPFKTTSISSLDKIIFELTKIIKNKLSIEIKFINDLVLIEDYRKFWENHLKLDERKQAIANKISLQQKYYHFFDNKDIIIIDDVVSTGTSIIEVIKTLKKFNNNVNVTALTYGSVYQWEKIYS